MPFGIAAAGISAAGAIAGGVMASKGAKKAGEAKAQGYDQATALQREMWQQQQRQMAPWLKAGGTGLNALMYGLGLGGNLPSSAYGSMAQEWNPEDVLGARPTDPEGARQWDINAAAGQAQFNKNQLAGKAQEAKNIASLTPEQLAAYKAKTGAGGLQGGDLMRKFSMADFEADPSYKFRLKEGIKSLDRSASSRGGLLSGAALKGIERYGQDLASQEYGNAFNRFQIGQTNQYNRLASLSGMGQQTAQQLGQSGQQYGQNMGNLAVGAGENQANALLAGANARGSMYQGIGSALGGGFQQYQNQQNFNKLFG